MFAQQCSNAAWLSRVRRLHTVGAYGVCLLVLVSASSAQVTTPTREAVSAPSQKASNLGDILSGQAKQEYEAGRLLYLDGDAASALVKFQSAYDISHDPRLLWNLAACHKQLRHYAKIERLLRQYLDEGHSLITEADRADANALLQTIVPLLADANIDASEPDASVYVDGEFAGKTPIGHAIRLDLGQRKIRVEKPGFVAYEETINVGGGSAIAVIVKLPKEVHEGRLRVVSDGGARIRIDGQDMGFGVWTGKLPSGSHTIDVAATGKQPYHSEVTLSDNQTKTLKAMLEDRRESNSGFDTTWIWVAGSALLATGLSIAGYYQFGPEHQTPNPPVGTLSPGQVQLSSRRR